MVLQQFVFFLCTYSQYEPIKSSVELSLPSPNQLEETSKRYQHFAIFMQFYALFIEYSISNTFSDKNKWTILDPKTPKKPLKNYEFPTFARPKNSIDHIKALVGGTWKLHQLYEGRSVNVWKYNWEMLTILRPFIAIRLNFLKIGFMKLIANFCG